MGDRTKNKKTTEHDNDTTANRETKSDRQIERGTQKALRLVQQLTMAVFLFCVCVCFARLAALPSNRAETRPVAAASQTTRWARSRGSPDVFLFVCGFGSMLGLGDDGRADAHTQKYGSMGVDVLWCDEGGMCIAQMATKREKYDQKTNHTHMKCSSWGDDDSIVGTRRDDVFEGVLMFSVCVCMFSCKCVLRLCMEHCSTHTRPKINTNNNTVDCAKKHTLTRDKSERERERRRNYRRCASASVRRDRNHLPSWRWTIGGCRSSSPLPPARTGQLVGAGFGGGGDDTDIGGWVVGTTRTRHSISGNSVGHSDRDRNENSPRPNTCEQ